MTLNGRNALWQKRCVLRTKHTQKMNEDRPILSTAKCTTVILVSRNRLHFYAQHSTFKADHKKSEDRRTQSMNVVSKSIRFVRIFTGSSYGAPNDVHGVLENGDVQTFPSTFSTLKLTLYSNTQSLISFSVIPKCVTLNDL